MQIGGCMRVNAINYNGINFGKAQGFNRLEAKKQIRETEKLVDKGIAEMYSEFDKYRGIPFDKTINYTSVSFNVPNKENLIATLAIQPSVMDDCQKGDFIVEVQDDESGVIAIQPIISGGRDAIVSFLNDDVNSLRNVTRSVLEIAEDIQE